MCSSFTSWAEAPFALIANTKAQASDKFPNVFFIAFPFVLGATGKTGCFAVLPRRLSELCRLPFDRGVAKRVRRPMTERRAHPQRMRFREPLTLAMKFFPVAVSIA